MKSKLFNWLMALAVLALLVLPAQAATNAFDAELTNLIEAPQSYFSTALSWTIGATGALIVIGWVLKAIRRR